MSKSYPEKPYFVHLPVKKHFLIGDEKPVHFIVPKFINKSKNSHNLGFENRVNGYGFDIEENTDYSYDEALHHTHKRIVSCYDQGKDKWQCTGITDYVLVDDTLYNANFKSQKV